VPEEERARLGDMALVPGMPVKAFNTMTGLYCRIHLSGFAIKCATRCGDQRKIVNMSASGFSERLSIFA
jgi:hypothetical protein